MAAIQIQLGPGTWLQSPYLCLKAAGSDATDDTVPGFHLRWSLLRTLGSQHLPKGNLSGNSGPYNATYGFNKDNDFVRIYRTTFQLPTSLVVPTSATSVSVPFAPYAILDFYFMIPAQIIETNVRVWEFSSTTNVPYPITVRFMDVSAYDDLRVTYDPYVPPGHFELFKRYKGVVEVERETDLWFQGIFLFEQTAAATPNDIFKVEGVSIHPDRFDDPDTYRFVSCRKKIHFIDSEEARTLKAENIKYFRFQNSEVYLRTLYFLSYTEYIMAVNNSAGQWTTVGDFGLTDDTTTAIQRLHAPPIVSIHKQWPKYNESDAGTGKFKVNVPNYVARWNNITDGLRAAVINYLTLSQAINNPEANFSIPSDDYPPDLSVAEISYLELLNMAGLDFHVARMLGLGHIENIDAVLGVPFNPPRRATYIAEYYTYAAIETTVPAGPAKHLYMALPSHKLDFRPPPVPRLKPITYGISLSDVENINGPATPATDEHGYSLFEDVRVINLNREAFEYEKPLDPFFIDEKEFIGGTESEAAAVGIEYKALSDPSFRVPEINNNPDYADLAGFNETVFVPDSDALPLFMHSETEEGIHVYGLYGVNIFSRPSHVGNLVETDVTKFVKKNTLVPPANFAVQLIQEEQPLIFTTQNEQTVLLPAITGPDKTLVRVTFDWNNTHNHAYQLGTHAEFFFRKELPKVVKGRIFSVSNLPNNRVLVTTERYPLTSSSPMQWVQPNISFVPPGDEDRFIGSSFASDGKLFIVDDITMTDASGDNPNFTLRKIRQTNTLPAEDLPAITETFIAPEAGKMFMVTENLNDPAQWDSLLTRKVFIDYFHTVLDAKISGSFTPANNRSYIVMNSHFNGTETEVTVQRTFANTIDPPFGNFIYSKKLKAITTLSQQVIKVNGDVTNELSAGVDISVIASQASDGSFIISNLFYDMGNGNTQITLNNSISTDDLQSSFYITFEKQATILSLSNTDKKITLNASFGNLTQELVPLYRETITESDGTETILNIGGMTDDCTITEVPDIDSSGSPIIGSRTGVYDILFQNLQLQHHITPDVEWYKGKVRIMEDAAFTSTPHIKELDVLDIDTTSNPTLKLTVYDPTIDVDSSYVPIGGYVPILMSPPPVRVNFHPSYRFYLKKDTASGNNFEEPVILPATGDGSRQTLMAARSIDKYISPQYESNVSVPAILLAMEIVEPMIPDPPLGPTFATRPDYYGKSTYSFDVKLNTSPPYAVIFYRANERMILDQLYLPATITQILTDLENLQSPDADYNVDRWSGLVNVDVDNDPNPAVLNLFKEYTPGGYRFPIPDNNNYSIPNQNTTAPVVHPFDGVTRPGAQPNNVQQAIDGAFLSLTEIPALVKYIPEDITSTRQTSGRPPKIRDIDGRLLLFGEPGFDPFPMAVKYNNGQYVKFTDYTLDGASKNFYFYYAVEMTNKLKMSGHGRISGPIFLINAAPAEGPGIKKVTSLLADSVNSIPTGVKFDINDYIESERIRKIQIFRTPDFVNSHTVRTMDLAKTVDIGNDIIDDFSDVPVPLFGKTLYYRLVALREILNESNQLEYVPSRPSQLVLSNVVDNFNPPAPAISFTADTQVLDTLPNVVLSWQPTCYNGKYYLYKMTPTGNWVKIHEIQSDDPISFSLSITSWANPNLVIEDDDGNTLYHRFRVEVENSSGLLNIEQNELTIPTP